MPTCTEPQTILATDCGSTTTKTILIERTHGEYRLTARSEAPTTVEAPAEDVTRGVINSIRELEEISGRSLTRAGAIWKPRHGRNGCDLYVGTSSAGGGLQMMVAGAIGRITAESAARAALGAGAIVMDTLAVDDGRAPHERVELIRAARPDMILLSGGTEGGATQQPVKLAQLIAAADARPRFGAGFKLPVVFAGNSAACPEIERVLGDKVALYLTENIRPALEVENLQPARSRIHDLFLEHVMAQAPGYDKLMRWTSAPLLPTPAAVGLIMQLIARREQRQIVGVDIGGATTDVFSVFRRAAGDPDSAAEFNRTVSANLGMSFSAFNVAVAAGLQNVERWLPMRLNERDLRDRLRNKMLRPTTIPQTLEDLLVEQALCREALRLAFDQHKRMAVPLSGVSQQRSISDAFAQDSGADTLLDMFGLDLLIGSGGVLSHAPRRVQAALLLVDGLQPEGFTELAVDSVFMMPHLGVLSTVHQQAALEVFDKDCLVRLGWCIAPRGSGKPGRPCLRVEIHSGEHTRSHELTVGELKRVALEPGTRATVKAVPARGFDLGAGPHQPVQRNIPGGVVGLILDARGRPLELPHDHAARLAKLQAWNSALEAYPTE
ncbi:MAG: glutamate mutase L [Planctomycetes bacterium]|nr:glutamate mutase L [Planctomycetota bacterium]